MPHTDAPNRSSARTYLASIIVGTGYVHASDPFNEVGSIFADTVMKPLPQSRIFDSLVMMTT